MDKKTPERLDSSIDGGFTHTNTKSVQELHTRNNELQTRIGDLEKILKSRLAEKDTARQAYASPQTRQQVLPQL